VASAEELRTLYQHGYALGRREADEQWATQSATLYVYGLRDRYDGLDSETGLTWEAIAQCIVTSEAEGRAAGHNTRIRDLIADQGVPPDSRRIAEVSPGSSPRSRV
jgi:hypothetical protein